MSVQTTSPTSADPTGRQFQALRQQLERCREGEAPDVEALLREVDRLEKLTSLLRRTALQGFGEFERSVGELSLINRVGSLFTHAFKEDQLCRCLLELVEQALPCTHAFLYLRPRGASELALRAMVGPVVEPGAAEAVERAAHGAVAREEPCWTTGTADSGDGWAGSLLACPLMALGQPLGVLVVTDPAAEALCEAHGRILRPIAGLAAVAVRHAWLCAENLENQRHLERIVEQRTREVNEARAVLSRHERVAAMGKLAASISHEVNNPMSFLVSNLERASEYVDDIQGTVPALLSLLDAAQDLPDSPDPRLGRIRELAQRLAAETPVQRLSAMAGDFAELIQEARDGTDRIRRVGEDLRSFAQGVAGVLEPVDLNRLVETALHIARADAKEGVEFRCDFGVLPEVDCQRYQIIQLLLNLLHNAVDAVQLQGEGSVRVTTRVAGAFVEVEIADDGAGLSPAEIGRIFEPFHTTKAEGSGLGLSISRDIATVHRGALEAISSPEGGVFVLRLPIAASADVAAEAR